MVSAVLFDLDDTLIDRSLSIERYSKVFERDFREQLGDVTAGALCRAFRLADEGGYHRGLRSKRLVERVSWRRSPTPAELDAHHAAEMADCCVARAGLFDLLDGLRALGLPLGLVTNGGEGLQNRKVDRLGLRERFDVIVISEAFRVAKPEAAIFRIAVEALRVQPRQSWFVGDHPTNDVLGADGAGLVPVWLRGMHPWPLGSPRPEIVIDTLPELLDHVNAALRPEPEDDVREAERSS